QLGDALARRRQRLERTLQERRADTGAADGDHAQRLVSVPELRALAERARVESGDVAGEVEVPLGPLADRGQVRAEALVDDVLGVADEDRPVADARVA